MADPVMDLFLPLPHGDGWTGPREELLVVVRRLLGAWYGKKRDRGTCGRSRPFALGRHRWSASAVPLPWRIAFWRMFFLPLAVRSGERYHRCVQRSAGNLFRYQVQWSVILLWVGEQKREDRKKSHFSSCPVKEGEIY